VSLTSKIMPSMATEAALIFSSMAAALTVAGQMHETDSVVECGQMLTM